MTGAFTLASDMIRGGTHHGGVGWRLHVGPIWRHCTRRYLFDLRLFFVRHTFFVVRKIRHYIGLGQITVYLDRILLAALTTDGRMMGSLRVLTLPRLYTLAMLKYPWTEKDKTP